MHAKRTFTIAVMGSSPSAERWLLADRSIAMRLVPHRYKLVADPRLRRPDLLVVDGECNQALVRWTTYDPSGEIPAVFLLRAPPGTERAVVVSRPITSGRVIESLDRMVRRLTGWAPALTTGARTPFEHPVPLAA